jgi:hypothetical protein
MSCPCDPLLRARTVRDALYKLVNCTTKLCKLRACHCIHLKPKLLFLIQKYAPNKSDINDLFSVVTNPSLYELSKKFCSTQVSIDC